MTRSLLEMILWETPEGQSAAADGGEVVVEGEAPVEPEAPAPAAPPTPQMVHVDVMQRRVAALTRQKADLEREVELLRLGQTLDPAAPAPAAPPAARPNMMSEAQAIAEQMIRNEKAQAVANAGAALAPDFMLRINAMNQMLGQLPNAFLDAVMDAGETNEGAAALLYDLSQDLQRAGTIISMSPTKMAVALTKLQNEKAKPAKPAPKTAPQAAPAPISPRAGVGGRSAPAPTDLADKNLGIDEWMKLRNESAATSRRY